MDCIFCKIARNELPAHVVYEDDDFIAFLDIFPVSRGHVQVIPKKHHRWIWDVPQAGAYFEVCKKVAEAQRQVFGVELVQVFSHGKEVEHAHIWVVPHTGEHVVARTGTIEFNEQEAPELSQQLHAAIPQ